MNSIKFKKSIPKAKRMTLTLTPEIAANVDELSKRNSTSKVNVILEAIQFYSFVLNLIANGSTIIVQNPDQTISQLSIE